MLSICRCFVTFFKGFKGNLCCSIWSQIFFTDQWSKFPWSVNLQYHTNPSLHVSHHYSWLWYSNVFSSANVDWKIPYSSLCSLFQCASYFALQCHTISHLVHLDLGLWYSSCHSLHRIAFQLKVLNRFHLWIVFHKVHT